ncbi:MAG TPA: hypothetical protein VHT91_41205 [Kofleriaceae bacterium]|jgi:hypothetical protein|nr:hypothetical protein [Kofleriaceae bacterium]
MSDPEAKRAQNSRAPARDRMRSRRVAIGQRVTPPAIGQLQPEHRRARPLLVAYPAAVIRGNPLDDRKPQAGAALLGRVERLEDRRV